MIGSCSHCNTDAKYKCPTCTAPYCSVNCYKKHKEVPCKEIIHPKLKESPRTVYDFPTEDTVAPKKLELLGQSKELRNYLVNPYLRDILEELHQCQHPDALMEKYMQEPIFTEFVDECLKIVNPTNES